jgi:hypothetical protein
MRNFINPKDYNFRLSITRFAFPVERSIDFGSTSFILSIINGIQRVEPKEYNADLINRLMPYYVEESLTALNAGEIVAGLFGYDLKKFSEESKWEFINKQRYLADINEDLEKTEVLSQRQLYSLSVNTLEKYLGRELK